jgi:hypothetical protein
MCVELAAFRWNDWNLDHATKHGIKVVEAESIVRQGRARSIGDEKWMVEGRGIGDRLVRVIFLLTTRRRQRRRKR